MTEQEIRDDERDLIATWFRKHGRLDAGALVGTNRYRPSSITIELTPAEADRVYSALLAKTCPEGYDCDGPSPRKCPDCNTIAKIDEARNES